jgi:hypothetical protein
VRLLLALQHCVIPAKFKGGRVPPLSKFTSHKPVAVGVRKSFSQFASIHSSGLASPSFIAILYLCWHSMDSSATESEYQGSDVGSESDGTDYQTDPDEDEKEGELEVADAQPVGQGEAAQHEAANDFEIPVPHNRARKRKIKQQAKSKNQNPKKRKPICKYSASEPKKVSVHERIKQFPDQGLMVRNQCDLFCKACNQTLALKKKTIQNHIRSAKHGVNRSRNCQEKRVQYQSGIVDIVQSLNEEDRPQGSSDSWIHQEVFNRELQD